MEIGISLVFIVLNVGLYFAFASSDHLRLKGKIKIAFFAIFILLSIVWVVSDNPDLQLIRISDFLLMNYVLGYLGYRYFFLPYFRNRNMEFPQMIRQALAYFLIPLYTIGATVVQIMLLFEK